MSDTSAEDPVGVRLQSLDLPEQGIVLARVATARSDGRAFRPQDLGDLFYEIGLPQPSNMSNLMTQLRRREVATPAKDRGYWQLTPLGRAQSVELLSDFDLGALQAEVAAMTGSELAELRHPVVPPSLAPPDLLPLLGRFLDEHEFDRNVFGMTRFPSDGDDESDPDPIAPALIAARDVCEAHGLEFHLASDRAMHDDLWRNVMAHMWASRYGIAFFEDRKTRGINYNLTIEVGGMLLSGRRCALIKDSSIERMPTDLVGMIYKPVDLDHVETVAAALHVWARDDLALGSCNACPKR